MKAAKENQGFVLTGVLMLLLVAALVGGAFLFSARNSFATVDQWRLRDECLFGLQSGLERREYELDQIVRTNNVHDINMFDGLANQSASKTILWTNFYSISPHVVTTLVVTTSGSVIKNLSNDTATSLSRILRRLPARKDL